MTQPMPPMVVQGPTGPLYLDWMDSQNHYVDPTKHGFNPDNYGAKGDGTTDDTAAIQGAINDAVAIGKGTVALPRTYKTTGPLNIPSLKNGLQFMGSGLGTGILATGNYDVFAFDVTDSTAGLTMRDMQITGTGFTPTSGSGVNLTGVKKAHLQNVRTTGVYCGFNLLSCDTVSLVSCSSDSGVNMDSGATNVQMLGGRYWGSTNGIGYTIHVQNASDIQLFGVRVSAPASSSWSHIRIESTNDGFSCVGGMFAGSSNYCITSATTNWPFILVGNSFLGYTQSNPVNYPSGSASHMVYVGNSGPAGPNQPSGSGISTVAGLVSALQSLNILS